MSIQKFGSSASQNLHVNFYHSKIDDDFKLHVGDEVEFYAQYNSITGKRYANKLCRINNLQRSERLITKLKTINFDENVRQMNLIFMDDISNR